MTSFRCKSKIHSVLRPRLPHAPSPQLLARLTLLRPQLSDLIVIRSDPEEPRRFAYRLLFHAIKVLALSSQPSATRTPSPSRPGTHLILQLPDIHALDISLKRAEFLARHRRVRPRPPLLGHALPYRAVLPFRPVDVVLHAPMPRIPPHRILVGRFKGVLRVRNARAGEKGGEDGEEGKGE